MCYPNELANMGKWLIRHIQPRNVGFAMAAQDWGRGRGLFRVQRAPKAQHSKKQTITPERNILFSKALQLVLSHLYHMKQDTRPCHI